VHGNQAVEELPDGADSPSYAACVLAKTVSPPRSGMISAFRIEIAGGVSMKVTSVCQPSRRGLRAGS
jgi:hypothetical protein